MFRKLHDPGPQAVTIFIDGRPVAAELGESVAAVLLRQQEGWSRTTPVSGSPRAPYCMMGVCFECLVEIDGQGSVQSCLTPVANGMRIARQRGRRSLSA
ncbi:2Fe-2S iron-sulfur cluster protein [Bosea sp. 62]|uniref:(2Fe-2S)-binding protein n=1 Tax=unclassified Bosea (in: a-proteobacteria) TaxID=2653178 RepID=UPI00125203D6|nr:MULTISPECIES: (2Fe-2S)-binding protein [unclassified Bosea (in: a-proteobacteria)]CAD5252811.1 2Fe-2S iron-sulfur cluster protein [Bosea sp. 46]CAD5257483.1 2Fe-2S iron-sulfur cluster protein [Bosea sp. 21B]CAD5283476.1 2Fe-2S iron-sulfur cluster protein [Bosea sp. 7B]VVT52235.1 (2Fe-2S)-binding protein [Bosea sp. EC-HK365B]VXB36555.1 2Fe-2S iron-sulfur cluster protein [Bosea sp. 29B]